MLNSVQVVFGHVQLQENEQKSTMISLTTSMNQHVISKREFVDVIDVIACDGQWAFVYIVLFACSFMSNQEMVRLFFAIEHGH